MVWQWAWRQTWRDWRAGQLRLLALALWLAVAAVTSVGFLSQRVQLGFERDARALLGGDLALSSDQPLPPTYAEAALAQGLLLSQTLEFPSVARAPQSSGGQVRLVSLKAVDGAWPLRGVVRIAGAQGELPEGSGPARPEPGTVWVDPDVLPALNLRVGDTILLGDGALRISHTLIKEPDRGGQMALFTPRVLMNRADLGATGLIQPASRVRYRLAVATPQFEANPPAVQRFEAWAQADITARHLRGVRTESLNDGNPQMRSTLDRAELFLRLVSLLAALLCAVAVAVVSRDFARHHLDGCALLRVLGQPQRRIATLYTLEFFFIGTLASGAGVVAGWGLHSVFVQLLTGLIDAQLPPPGWQPALVGGVLGLTLMAAFGLPPVLRLAQVSPLRVLRRDLGAPGWPAVGALGLGLVGVAGLLWMVADDVRLGAWVIGGFVAALALFAAVAYALVRGLHALLSRLGDGPKALGGTVQALRLAVRQMASRPELLTVQVAALSVGLTALVLLVILRTDLIQQWQDAAPVDAPNRFVINIQPDQTDDFRQQLRTEGVTRYDWSPMVRGRLVRINDTPVDAAQFSDPEASRSIERELNLSYTPDMPPQNTLEEGQWRPMGQSGLAPPVGQTQAISVEKGLMQRLNLKLGDTLHFNVAGQPLSARITSTRGVDWGSMRVNFFVIFPYKTLRADAVPGMAGGAVQDDSLPATWITAFHAPQDARFDARLMQRFPNITLVNIEQTLKQVRAVLDQVVRAVELLFVFSLAAGLVVLVATMASTRQERLRDLALMRALGASRALLARMQRLELLALGALAGVLASVCANAVAYGLATQVFGFADWSPAWTSSLLAVLGSSLLCVLVGGWQLRGVAQASVTQTLREAPAG